MPELTVGLYTRDRFSPTARGLSVLLRNTSVGFRLLVVDCGMPERIRGAVDRMLEGVDDAHVIETQRNVPPNESINLIMAAADTEYVCLLENDMRVGPGCLDRMLEAAGETSAAVARPMLYQRWGVVHFDRGLGALSGDPRTPQSRLRINGKTRASEYDPGDRPREVEWTEFHCIMLRRDSMTSVFPLDPEMSEPEHVDFNLRLHAADARIVLEPRAKARLATPPPVKRSDLDFFDFRWDRATAQTSHERFRRRWNIHYPGLMAWVDTVPARKSWLRDARLRLQRRLSPKQ